MVSSATWNELADHYDTQHRMRIAVTAARARAAAMTVNALGVQPHEDDEPLPVLEGY